MPEQTLADATSGVFSQLAHYVMTVADKYGHEEAFDLLSHSYSEYGTQIGGMMKEQLEGKEATAEDIFAVVGPGNEAVGFGVEVIESTPEKVSFRIGRCPLYEGCQAVGATPEEFCDNLGMPFMNGVAKAMNPDAEYSVVGHRTSADGFCVEQITT